MCVCRSLLVRVHAKTSTAEKAAEKAGDCHRECEHAGVMKRLGTATGSAGLGVRACRRDERHSFLNRLASPTDMLVARFVDMPACITRSYLLYIVFITLRAASKVPLFTL